MKVSIKPYTRFDDKVKIAKAARIIALREELAAKRAELEQLVVDYLNQNPVLSYRECGVNLKMDHGFVWAIAKKFGVRQKEANI